MSAATNPLTAKKEFDTVSEAGTIKDSGDEEANKPGNDNTEIDEDNKSILVDESKCPPQFEESSM